MNSRLKETEGQVFILQALLVEEQQELREGLAERASENPQADKERCIPGERQNSAYQFNLEALKNYEKDIGINGMQ